MRLVQCAAALMQLALLAIALPSLADADDYRMTVSVDVSRSQLDGDLTLIYRNEGTQSLDNLRLRLDGNTSSSTGSMTVSHVRNSDGKELPWRYCSVDFGPQQSEKGQIAVDLPMPLAPSDNIQLQIGFQYRDLRVVQKGDLILQDDPYHSLDAWYPKAMRRMDNNWSLNDDRPSCYDVAIDVPAEFDVASTGKIESSRPAPAGSKIVRLRADHVRGFTIYCSNQWKSHRRMLHGVDLGIHIVPQAEQWADTLLEAAAEAIGYYQAEYGPFPSDHLEITCVGDLTGHTHGSSATCNGIGLWLHANLESQYRSLVAHEVAHQYFGSTIGIHRREVAWAPIGLGMVMEHHYMVDRGLDERPWRKTIQWFYLEAVRRKLDTTLSRPVEEWLRQGPPMSFGWNMALMHGKAYEVCKMLEAMLGEQRFKNVIRKIVSERKGGLLSGTDLVAYCEDAYGEPVDWFVADWIDGRATLDYAVAEVYQADGKWEVEISKLGGAAFPVIVQAETESGETLRQQIDRKAVVDRLTFRTAEQLKRVVVDPDGICPDTDVSNNYWPKQSSSGANE